MAKLGPHQRDMALHMSSYTDCDHILPGIEIRLWALSQYKTVLST